MRASRTKYSYFYTTHFHWFLLFVLLCGGTYLRSFGFFLPTSIGDQSTYQSLAMKLNYGFMKQYDIYNYQIIPRMDAGLVDYVWENDPKLWQANKIRKIYHRPFHVVPPVYPILIWISHGIFNYGEPYTSVSQNYRSNVVRSPPWHFMKAQFYALIVPIVFSFALNIFVYLFCLRYFSYREGLLAVLLLSVAPVDIAISSKILCDGILSCFCFLALMLYLKSLDNTTKHPIIYSTLAGLSLGLAFLTKFSGLTFALVFIIATLLNPNNSKNILKKILDPRLSLAGLMVIVVTSPWHYLVYQHFGTILSPFPLDLNNSWSKYIFGRPVYLYWINLISFTPAFAIGLLMGIMSIFKRNGAYIEKILFVSVLLFYGTLWILFKTYTIGMEDRYFLPAYPAIAILSAIGITHSIAYFKNYILKYSLCLFYALMLIFVTYRGIDIGLSHLFAGLVVFN